MIWFSGDKHLFHEMMVRGKHACSKCRTPLRVTEAMKGISPCCNAEVVQTEAAPRSMFKNVWDMNKTIIDNHNEVVEKGDLVYELGDLFLKINAKIARETRYLMNGNFYFVNGNHDQVAEQIPDCFVWMKDLIRIKPAGFDTPHITLCHYAMRVWHGSHKGTWQLYGHSHGQLPELDSCLAFDVGVDANNFYPVSIEQVIERMKPKIELWKEWRAKLKKPGGVGQ